MSDAESQGLRDWLTFSCCCNLIHILGHWESNNVEWVERKPAVHELRLHANLCMLNSIICMMMLQLCDGLCDSCCRYMLTCFYQAHLCLPALISVCITWETTAARLSPPFSSWTVPSVASMTMPVQAVKRACSIVKVGDTLKPWLHNHLSCERDPAEVTFYSGKKTDHIQALVDCGARESLGSNLAWQLGVTSKPLSELMTSDTIMKVLFAVC